GAVVSGGVALVLPDRTVGLEAVDADPAGRSREVHVHPEEERDADAELTRGDAERARVLALLRQLDRQAPEFELRVHGLHGRAVRGDGDVGGIADDAEVADRRAIEREARLA